MNLSGDEYFSVTTYLVAYVAALVVFGIIDAALALLRWAKFSIDRCCPTS